MRSGQTVRVRLDILAVMLVLGTLVPIAGAQTERVPGPPVAAEAESPMTPGIEEGDAELRVVFLGVAVLILVMVAVAHAIG